MAVVYTVDTDGVSGDYASLALAIAAVPDPLGDNYTINCQATTGVADTTLVNIGQALATFTLTINGQGMSSTLGLDAAKYRLVTADQGDEGVIDILATCDNGTVIINGMQIDSNPTTHGHGIKTLSGSTAIVWVTKTYIRITKTGTYYNHGLSLGGGSLLKVRNCVLVMDGGAATVNQKGIYQGIAVNSYVYNCTLDGWYNAVHESSGTMALRNCGAINSVSDPFLSVTTEQTNSATAPTFSSGYLLGAADVTWKDQGTDLSGDANLAVTDDALGNARSAPYDIGADEYVAAGGAANYIPAIYYMARMRNQ